MKKINENRPGYKKTKVGWIPEEWRVEKLRRLLMEMPCYGLNAPACEYSPELPRYLRITDISDDGEYKHTKKASVNHSDSGNYCLSVGDIVLARTGASVGKSYLYNERDGQLVYAGFLIKISPDGQKLLPGYLKSHFNSSVYWRWVQVMSSRSGQPGINASEYASMHIPLPPLPEQKKIAEILSTWDDAIQAQEKLIKQKMQCRNATAQKLLSEKNINGEKKKLSSFLKPEVRVVTKPSTRFLALGIKCHGKGIFHKKDFEPGKIALEELYEVKQDDLVVNITFAWEGAIAIASQEDDGGLVSHRFPTFSFNENKVLPGYFKYVIYSNRFLYYLPIVSPGGAGRNRVMNKKDFLKLKVIIPSLEQQEKISNLLGALDKELEVLEKKRDALKIQKKGLMQQLLTGAKRVRIEEFVR